jgi:hypothetical protein
MTTEEYSIGYQDGRADGIDYVLAQPRAWVGLTDEEKESLINKKVDGAYLTVMETIELTEVKLKEKNNG